MCSLLRDHQAVLRQRQKESLYDAARKTVPLVSGAGNSAAAFTRGQDMYPACRITSSKPQASVDDGVDWPLSYEDLAPYYDIVERTLGVHGKPAGIPNCPDGQFIGPAKTTKIEEAFLTNVEKRLPNVRVTYGRTVKYDNKRIPLPLRLALATGRLDIRTDAVVSRLLIDAQSGKATGVEYVDRSTKNTHAVHGKVVVLCASAIESVRILLNSQSAKHPSGVGGSSGHLGRYLCDHVAYAQTGDVAEGDAEPAPSEDGFDFAATGLYIPSFCEKESTNFPGGYGIQIGIGRGKPTWEHVRARRNAAAVRKSRVARPDRQGRVGHPGSQDRVQSFSG